MESFDLESHLNDIYAVFPEGNRRPVIGLTSDHADINATLRDRYYKQVVAAGGTPVIIPPVADRHVIISTLEHIDALILTGGADVNPLWAGEEPESGVGHVNGERDLAELLICRLALNRQIPILGICRGMQTLAIALDGHVRQDMGTPTVKHSQNADRTLPTHSVYIEQDSYLYAVYQSERIFVNSFHHQAVDNPGQHLRVTAQAADGTIEGVESTEHKSVLGVQWHPEWLEADGQKLFSWLVERAAEYREACDVHARVLTLDTHCDTPMFFPQGIHFEQRDPRILVDLHKMTDGRQDAVTMVAYLPQPREGEDFAQLVDYARIQTAMHRPGDTITPTQYANLIFDKIEEIVVENSRYVAIARTPQQLYDNKAAGRKSIMLGIENGLALGQDLSLVKHFADRGIVYITLCHNGDNDICDSAARTAHTHNGLSAFGEQVIHEMNRRRVMVDLSHGGEKSFYDALEISRTPIVCSHSSCRELCDVPRNLYDDQLRALAAKGGVAQITIYKGFLRKDSNNASIMDVMQHLEHAIAIAGIDHVGLGTDFDGDGGAPGLADSSELINFTIRLLRKRYSEDDIRKIWGGNWLRVMTQVQNFGK
uniref:Fused gamma-glutamyl-gamma-aminobutyrate hydrolase/peptidase n=1 Tax=Prevotella sp. GTC17262 TaxID=3236797 RepID=A0AB33JSG1_9BACT